MPEVPKRVRLGRMVAMIRFALFGAGRIGSMHAGHLAACPGARLVCVYDPVAGAAAALAEQHGAAVADSVDAALSAGIDAVLIASSTDTHVNLIVAAAQAGKAIFCEKPIDLSLRRVEECWEQVRDSGIPIQIGFNRRYDASHRGVRERVAGGEIGALHQVIITSRDPAPPPLSYVRASGGLFRDMMIHDFDLARFVLAEEPVTVTAVASVLITPEIAELGDIDTAMVLMTTASGMQCHINCSRQAVYGYDQRLEAHGSAGMVCSANQFQDQVRRFSATSAGAPAPLQRFFIDRYQPAYQAQLADFVDAVATGREPSVTFEDGRRALMLAEAAIESLATAATIPVPPPAHR